MRSTRTMLSLTLLAGTALVACGDDTATTPTSTAAPVTSGSESTTTTHDMTTVAATSEAPSATADEVSTNTATVVDSLPWPDNVSVTIDQEAGTWTITTNGRPDHELPDQYLIPKPGVDARTVTLDILEVGATADQVVEGTWTLPLNPVLATDSAQFGSLGIARSGGWINDPYEGDQKTIALESNFTIDGVDFIDDCSGHFNPMGYHYHGIPYCITSAIDTAGEHSRIVGFAADGFPIYGPQGDDGEEPTDLNDCRGHVGPTPEFPDGIFHYHLTTTFPYTMLCLSGEFDASETIHAGMQH